MNGKLTRKVTFSTLMSGTLLATALSQLTPANAQTSLPITNIVFFGANDGTMTADFTVPDRNTTASAYGGKLRRYDAHVAKMFELTDFECRDSQRDWNRIIWRYYAGNGDINMGAFDISCNQARNIAIAYGLGQRQRTEVFYYRAPATINVPKLNITGNKISTWLRFVQNFPPKLGD
jgi:serine/threonine-protein kinase